MTNAPTISGARPPLLERIKRARVRLSILLLIWIAVWLFSCAFAIGFVTTPSVSARLVLIVRDVPVKLGDLVYYEYAGEPNPSFRQGHNMVHFVAGLPGGRVASRATEHGTEIVVDGRSAGIALDHGERIRGLTPIVDVGRTMTIPDGSVFVSSPAADGYDSRYHQHGLVPLSAIHGRAYKIL